MAKTANKKRKVIDLDENTFRILSIRAAAKGTNLKNLIENSLKSMADNLEDSELYSYLLDVDPEGKEYLNKAEQQAFEKEMGL
ncbi:hypothetical protein [Maribellus sediminis]|uniref:hypothetical protein n=1 Tax=Maribellus sediminis TaxID=2696285 RepID=UPI001431B03E|nr:hypothetical protein [Maribellus sediminis]